MSTSIAIIDLTNSGRREGLIKAFCGIGLDVFFCLGNDAKLYRCTGLSSDQRELVDKAVAVNLILSHGSEFNRARDRFQNLDDVRILHFSAANGRATDEKLGPKLWRGLSSDIALSKWYIDALCALAKAGRNADLADERWARLFKENQTPNLDAFVLLLKAWSVLEFSAKEAVVRRGCEGTEINVIGPTFAVGYFRKILRQVAQEAFPEEPNKSGELYVEALIHETEHGAHPLRLETNDKPTLRALLIETASAAIGQGGETTVETTSPALAEDPNSLAQRLAGWSAELAKGAKGIK